MTDHWRFFDFANVLSEAKERLREARLHPAPQFKERGALAVMAGCLVQEPLEEHL